MGRNNGKSSNTPVTKACNPNESELSIRGGSARPMMNRVCGKTCFSQTWRPPKWNADAAKDTRTLCCGAI